MLRKNWQFYQLNYLHAIPFENKYKFERHCASFALLTANVNQSRAFSNYKSSSKILAWNPDLSLRETVEKDVPTAKNFITS